MKLVLWHHRNRREFDRAEADSDCTTDFAFEGADRKYIRDYSYIWDSGQTYDERKLWRKAADAVFNVLAANETADSVRQSLFDVLLADADLGAIWNRLLLVGARLPENFGQRLAQLLTHPVFLREFETRHAAGKFLEQSFGTWEEELRARIESAIMQVGCEVKHSRGDSQEAAERVRDSLIACLPEAAIVSDEVRVLSDRIRLDGSATPPSVAFGQVKSGFISEEDDLREKGQLKTEAQRRFFELREGIKLLGRSSKSLAANDVPAALETISSYEVALAAADSDAISEEQTVFSKGEITAAFSVLANVEDVPSTDRDLILRRLLEFATDAEPRHCVEDDARWDEPSPHWGCPFPRIEAAWGLMRFLRHAEAVDEATRAAVLRLADDLVPAVRYPIIQTSSILYKIDPESFWKLIAHRVEAEERLALLEDAINVLTKFSPNHEQADCVDQIIRQIEARIVDREGAGFVRKAMVVHHLRRLIYLGDNAAENWLNAVVDSPFEHSEELDELLRLWEDLLSEPQPTDVFTADEIVSRGIETLIIAFDASYAAWAEKPWEGKEGDQARGAFYRATGPMMQVVQTTSQLLGKPSHLEEPAPREDYERVSRAVTTFRPLIEKCVTIPLPSEAYDFLQTLQYISPVVPGGALLWIRTLVRSAINQGFLSDGMGADLLIALLERYLVEHRGLLSKDAEVRDAMIDLLNDCVRYRWPKAGPLLVRLNEVFRA